MAFLSSPVRLRSILVGIAQGLFEIEVGDIAEAAACQADGFFFRDVATVALVAEAVKEIVPVSGFKAFFPSGVFHGFAEVSAAPAGRSEPRFPVWGGARLWGGFPAFLVFTFFFGRQRHSYGQRLYILQSFGRKESLRIV